jgi:hypothetical protein
MRTRIFERYAELRAEGQQLQAQLDALDATTPHAADTTLLDQLPLPGTWGQAGAASRRTVRAARAQ